ncbi:acyl carrier protein [Mycoplasmopsis maculosa]|uniref:Acyl carrier protein n=1 Tax=Mycoplasmopsis maculosa TaxID=114885 RepID=A0A449B4A1_9BACT|nr:phosphopantetheine-binding protein [Mycoplasmopsis maculosa]VEU75410.1 acyl carrier protein [Mycoplasmopsis maculosa]
MDINYIIARIQSLTKKPVTLESEFSELQIDSLSLAEMVFQFEEKYEVTIADEDLMKVKKVKDIVEVFDKLLK